MQIRSGASTIIGEKNEDRTSIYHHHGKEGMRNVSSFSVFDGHAGDAASTLCSTHFNASVVRRLHRLIKASSGLPVPPTQDSLLDEEHKLNAMITEAIRMTCEEMDLNVKEVSKAGTTLNSLFIHHNESTKVSTLFCANIGDSKCVMFPFPFLSSSDRRRSLSRSTFTSGSSNDDLLLGNNNTCALAAEIIPMSIDHKLSSTIERVRLTSEDMYTVPWSPLPYSSNTGYPSEEEQKLAEEFISRITSNTSTAKDLEPTKLISSPHPLKEMTRVRSNSFIAHRKCGSLVGPEALHGCYNISLNMTRSIGDKFGPRSCVAIPDVKCVQLASDESVRLILASDGLWDVLSKDEVGKLLFLEKNPKKAAELLANCARDLRKNFKIRMDDISVVVVDILCSSSPIQEKQAGCGCIVC